MSVRKQFITDKRESQVEAEACQRILLELGIFSLKLKRTSEAGWPDRLFILPFGRSHYIEFKRPKKEARANQGQIHERLAYFGHTCEVHSTVDGAVESVRRALEAATLHGQGSKVAVRTRRSRAVP